MSYTQYKRHTAEKYIRKSGNGPTYYESLDSKTFEQFIEAELREIWNQFGTTGPYLYVTHTKDGQLWGHEAIRLDGFKTEFEPQKVFANFCMIDRGHQFFYQVDLTQLKELMIFHDTHIALRQ